jgi:hypothetical protein
MSLTYHYSFHAPAGLPAERLTEFLCGVETAAQGLGFSPTLVFAGLIDTPERAALARRMLRPLTVADPRLAGRELPAGLCWTTLPGAGVCRLAPIECVVLVVTDERGCESVFGFCRFPTAIRDRMGDPVMDVPEAEGWSFGGCVSSPDRRYRAIVRLFADAGFLARENDEFRR